MSLAIPNAATCSIEVVTTGGQFVGQFGFGLYVPEEDLDQTKANSIAGAFATAVLANNVDDAWSNQMHLNGLRIHQWYAPALADLEATLSTPGGETGNPLPYNVALITSWRTGLAGPSYRGRTYIPMYTEPSSDSNTVNATTKANLAAMWTAFRTALGPISTLMDIGVVSRKVPTVNGVTAFTVEGLWATQRRRLSRARNS